MSVVVTRSVRCHFNSPPQQGQRMLVTGTSTGSASAVAGGASRRWKGPCPGFRPGRLQWALRLPLENGVADRALLRRSFSSFFTSSRNRSFSVWTRVNSPRRDWFSSSKSSIRWQLSSGSGPVIQTTITDPARNVQEFSFRWSTSYGPVCPAMPVIRYVSGNAPAARLPSGRCRVTRLGVLPLSGPGYSSLLPGSNRNRYGPTEMLSTLAAAGRLVQQRRPASRYSPEHPGGPGQSRTDVLKTGPRKSIDKYLRCLSSNLFKRLTYAHTEHQRWNNRCFQTSSGCLTPRGCTRHPRRRRL